jgi:hypothetical protein
MPVKLLIETYLLPFEKKKEKRKATTKKNEKRMTRRDRFSSSSNFGHDKHDHVPLHDISLPRARYVNETDRIDESC